MKRLAALIIALVLTALPFAAHASNYIDFSIILGAGNFINGGTWAVDIDSTDWVSPTDSLSFIVTKLGGYLDPQANYPWVEFGNITTSQGSTQYYYTRQQSTLQCYSPYFTAFSGSGCEGPINQWGMAQSELAKFLAEYEPISGNQYEWLFYVVDKDGAYHPIAVQSPMSTGAWTHAELDSELIYYQSNNPEWIIQDFFNHPLAGANLSDIPTAYSTFTYSNPADSGMCPYVYAISQFADQRMWLVGNPIVSPKGPTCNSNPFWPR